MALDIYQNMEVDSNGTTLTDTNADSGSHGTGGSWSVVGTAIKISTTGEEQLRGPVTVINDTTYTDSGATRSWRVPDNVDGARAIFSFDTSKSTVVISGYITIGPTGGSFELYDFIHVRHAGQGTIMQLATGPSGNPELQIEVYSPTDHSASDITVVAGQTYWYSFKVVNGGTSTLNVYNISTWTLMGSITATSPSGNVDSIYFGVGSDHGNDSATSTYFDDICISWTDTTFPFLPEESSGIIKTRLKRGIRLLGNVYRIHG